MSTVEYLKSIHQQHIAEAYEKATPQEQQHLDKQIKHLNQIYPGGLKNYYERALQLIKESVYSANTYQQYKVCQPNGVHIDFADAGLTEKYQTIGMKQIEHTVFILVAGGLGERLGYPGIKIAIPLELLTEKSFIGYYIEYILAFQKKYCKQETKIPLIIMTSDDTHTQTVQFLEQNKNFGMVEGQITILKQEKIPAMLNIHGQFALLKNKLEIQTKPHGHGDIHTLVYQNHLVQKWSKQGKKWAIFFQDTNPLSFRSMTALLGVSAEKDYDYNTIGVIRKVGQAMGAITFLQHKETGAMRSINVQYNQLEGLFKQSGGQKSDAQGNSAFPGNTNCFAIKISKYEKVLEETKGTISQFINPKYTDNTKSAFKSAARLQCMMQDFLKLLPNCEKVGFTSINRVYSYACAKNDPVSAADKFKQGIPAQSAGSCQANFYHSNRQVLRLCGAEIADSQPVQFGNIPLHIFPMVTISPSFATCITEMRKKVNKLKISSHSSLIIQSDCILDDVQVDGHAQIKNEGHISLKINDKNYKHLVNSEPNDPPYLQIRKYKLQK